MKHTYTFLAAILITAGLFAQTPAKMTYQAVIRNANGELVSTQVGMRISILQGADADTASEVYSETLTPTPNQNGLLSIEFGGETAWDAINWSEGSCFIKTEIDPTGGINYSITGISQLLSVPYALHAKTAETATITGSETTFEEWDKNANDDFSGNYNDLSNLPDLSGYLAAEQDSSVTNELQTLSISGDTIYLSRNGEFVKLPDGFSGSFQDLTDLPPNLDTDSTDDFSGNYNDLINLPTIPDTSGLEKFETSIEELQLLQKGLTDSRDSNVYRLVKIGDQIWMAENLAYEIPNKEITDSTDWADNTSYDAWCYYDNNRANYGKYGVLYNWYAVDQEDICPEGWHVPSDAEWTELENYLIENGYNYDRTTSDNKIGKALATASGIWRGSSEVGNVGNDQDSNNRSGFSALPGGHRDYEGVFYDVGFIGVWWSSTGENGSHAWSRYLNSDYASFYRDDFNKRSGWSVRCKKDSQQGLSPTVSTNSVTDATPTSAISGGNISDDGGKLVTERGVCWSTDSNPTTSDSKTRDGVGTGSFTSSLSGLTESTRYYLRAYAVNSVGTAYGNEEIFTTTAYNTFTDPRDSTTYKIIDIGNQTWMAENLAYLPEVQNSVNFASKGNSSEPAYGVYGYEGSDLTAAKSKLSDKTSEPSYETYGAFYNWYAVERDICPEGWHVPSNGEWTELINYLGGITVAGGKLKAPTHWDEFDEEDVFNSNESGFTALGSGYLHYLDLDSGNLTLPVYEGEEGRWWTSSSDHSTNEAYAQGLEHDSSRVLSHTDQKETGSSVRCLRD